MKNIFSFFILTFFSFQSFCCTTMIFTKGATKDGSVIVTHSDDNELGDQRIVFVPPQDHKKGSKRPICATTINYPRYVGTNRGPMYDTKGEKKTEVLGYIDQVEHTYGYIDGNNAIVNEKQLGVGECTNWGKHSYKPSNEMIFNIIELAQIALERCSKAQEAIKLIGSLAEKYGYYDEAETLLFADTEEGWVFEITASPYAKGALWVAKKVPDGEIFVAANELRIRDISPKDKDILYSKDLFDIAKKEGWFDEKKGSFDWLPSVSPGETKHPYYALRRVWRLQSRINPDLNLSPWVKDGYTKDYPFSIKPKKKFSFQDVIDLYRDHYEGTEFDQTKGLAAGPFGYPQRYLGKEDTKLVFKDKKGAWERPISVFYTGYVTVTQLRGYLPDCIGARTWIGLDSPAESCFAPFYPCANSLPISYQTGSTAHFSHDTAWWAYNFVANYSSIKYSYMIKDINQIQSEIENYEAKEVQKIEKKALSLYKQDPVKCKQYLANYSTKNANKILNKWWQLSYYLIEKYSDGYINKPKPYIEVGYPKWWRDDVGYDKGPITYKETEH